MKIYTKVRIDMLTGETIEEESFEYDGPLALGMGFDASQDHKDQDAATGTEAGAEGSEDPYEGENPDDTAHGGPTDKDRQDFRDQMDKENNGMTGWDTVKSFVKGLLGGGLLGGLLNSVDDYNKAKAAAEVATDKELKELGWTDDEIKDLRSLDVRDFEGDLGTDPEGNGAEHYTITDEGFLIPKDGEGGDGGTDETTFADIVNSFSADKIGYSPATIKMESGASALQGTVGALLNAFYKNPDADPSALLSEFFTDINDAKTMITEGGEKYRERLEGISQKWDLGSEQLWNLADNYRVNHDNRMADIQAMKGPYLSIGGKQVVNPDTAENVRLTPSRHQRNAAALAGQELSGGLAGVQSQRDSAEQWKTGALDTADRWYGSKTNDGKDKAALSSSKLDKLMKDIPGIYGDILGSQTQIAVANANAAGQSNRAQLDANTRLKIAQLQALAGENEAKILAQNRLDVAEEEEPSTWEKVLTAIF